MTLEFEINKAYLIFHLPCIEKGIISLNGIVDKILRTPCRNSHVNGKFPHQFKHPPTYLHPDPQTPLEAKKKLFYTVAISIFPKNLRILVKYNIFKVTFDKYRGEVLWGRVDKEKNLIPKETLGMSSVVFINKVLKLICRAM